MSVNEATKRFYELVWPNRALVLRMAHILLSSEAEAEDLAQETMIKAFRFIERFKDGTDIKAWLVTILRNARIDLIRSKQSSGGIVSLEQLDVEPAEHRTKGENDSWEKPEDVLEAISDQQIIAALKQLPEEIRWTLLLVDVEAMDHADAARILDVPVGTVKSRTHRGRAMLRTALAPLARDFRLIPD